MENSWAPLRTPSLQGMPSLPLKNFLDDHPGSSPSPTRWLIPGGRPSPHQGITLEVLLPLPESPGLTRSNYRHALEELSR